MMKMIFAILMLTACTSPQNTGSETGSGVTEEVARPVSAPQAEAPAKSEAGVSASKPAPAPVAAPQAPAPSAASAPAAAPTPAQAPAPTTQIWKLQKGKLNGPFAFGHPTVLSKSKNKKGNGTTTETCYRYATYAVVELKSSDEIGSAELAVRHDPPKGFALCLPEFKGKTTNLRIIEGYFAGVSGGLIMVDGADSSEGQTEFQLFQADTGQEVMKSFHHPTEDFTIIKNGDNITLEYFAKLPVKCGLAQEGEKCWKEVLKENKVVGKTPMPDCAGIFGKSNTSLNEPALVFTRARVTKPGSAPRFLGGKSTCQPAP